MNGRFDELTQGLVQLDTRRGSTVVRGSSPVAVRLLMLAIVLAASTPRAASAQVQTNDCSCYRSVTNWHGTFTTKLSGSGVEDSGGTFRFNNSSQGSFDCNGRTSSSAVTGSGIVDRLENWGCNFLSYQGSGPLRAPSIAFVWFHVSNCTYSITIAEGITATAHQHICPDPDPPYDLYNDVWYGVGGVFALPEFGQPIVGSITTNVPWNGGFLTLDASWHVEPVIDTAPPKFTSIPLGGPLGCNPTNIPDDISILALASATAASGQVGITATHVDTSTGCETNRLFTLTALDLCFGTVAHAAAVYTWTTDTNPPVFLEVPPGRSLGNNPTTLPDDTTVKVQVRATDLCGPAVIEVTHVDGDAAPQFNRTFTIMATDPCLHRASRTVLYSWTISTGLPPLVTARVGANFAISWPSGFSNVVLQATTNLLDPNSWQTILIEPTAGAGWFYVTNNLANPFRFFRLREQ